MRDSPPLLRRFPRADRQFQREVERLFAGWVEAQQGRNLQDGVVRRAIHVLKTRASDHDDKVRELVLDGRTVRVADVLPISAPVLPQAGVRRID